MATLPNLISAIRIALIPVFVALIVDPDTTTAGLVLFGVVVATDWVMKVPVAGQMILGFILPFALAFVVIPFEYFMHAARNVCGALFVIMMRAVALILRILSNAVRHTGMALVLLYDAVIFLPLILERAILAKRMVRKPEAHAGALGSSVLGGEVGSRS